MSFKLIVSIAFLIVFVSFAGVALLKGPPEREEAEEPLLKAQPYFREHIEEEITAIYGEGLKFPVMDYKQTDPMQNGLYHCTGTIINHQTGAKYSYSVRIGHDPEVTGYILYFMQVDGVTVYWDEEGEDTFIENH